MGISGACAVQEQCAIYKGNKSLMLALELKVGFEPGINKVGPA